MMEEGPADLRELASFPDVLVVSSSAGWTDQKHMVYLSLLEESFVGQLHGAKISFEGLLNFSPRFSRPKQSYTRSDIHTEVSKGYLGADEVDSERADSWKKVERIKSPCCDYHEEGEVHSMDDDASTTELVQKASSRASATSYGQSSTCHLGKYRHSPFRDAEGSDQNFIDKYTNGIGESRRRCEQKATEDG